MLNTIIEKSESLSKCLESLPNNMLLEIYDECRNNTSFGLDSSMRKLIDLYHKCNPVYDTTFHISLISITFSVADEIRKRLETVV
jgi:hypothetical protein